MDYVQQDLWASECVHEQNQPSPEVPFDPLSYDRYVVFFSGGKDSLACVLHLLEIGVPAWKIVLHHHLVDGAEGSNLMDWPVTEAYCKAVANHLGMSFETSWRAGGFEAEMQRQNSPTGAVMIPDGKGGHVAHGGQGPVGTRLKFPQVSADLSTRWCSAYLKIDIGSTYLRHDQRYRSGKTLVVTGERAQESAARAKYRTCETHRADLRHGRQHQRHIDHWRPIHAWLEEQVWDIIRRHGIRAHPGYHLGWGRLSCRQCIFGSKNQWATIRLVAPDAFDSISTYEKRFGVTIQRKHSVDQLADMGTPYECEQKWIDAANSREMTMEVYVGDSWELPRGAFGESAGPT